MKRISPLHAFFNKDYQSRSDGPILLKIQKIFSEALSSLTKDRKLPEHIFYSDDCFVAFRNLGFLSDQDFYAAITDSRVNPVVMGRLWRLWVVSWSFDNCWALDGDHVDCGTYNGDALETALNYTLARKSNSLTKKFVYGFDIFDSPPAESRKSEHSEMLFGKVSSRFDRHPFVRIVKGVLPKSLDAQGVQKIAWCQIDLNSAEADGACFEFVVDRLVDGAVVIFDDYGFSRYKSTQDQLDSIAVRHGSRILELPTGQGLYIHRAAT